MGDAEDLAAECNGDDDGVEGGAVVATVEVAGGLEKPSWSVVEDEPTVEMLLWDWFC